ncbi:MAG TPA: IS256 family transposase [Pyrinomonadaceae bacterium]|nr:IS256 family transposase [Pyrinomonadaceae bacterium]
MTNKNEEHDRLLDELLKGKSPEQILGAQGLIKQITKRMVERALQAELTAHLGYEPHERGEAPRENARNGVNPKTVLGDSGTIEIEVPRDRIGSFEPQLVKKRQRRLAGFDEKVISLYARGMTTREIQGHLQELYGAEVSPTLISVVTDAVIDDLKSWQSRPLDALYPIVYFDALFVKSRQEGMVAARAVYLALAVNANGEKELLGLWIAKTEGAKFWLNVMTELKNRGMRDCFVACVDGLAGFREAIESIFPQTQVQLCIVHKVRQSLNYVSWKERKAVAADLRRIYASMTIAEAEQALAHFAETWDAKYPAISRTWRTDWAHLTTFFDYPPEIRKVIYTTNAIESLNHSLRKIIKTRGAFPDDEAVMKLLYLALQNVARRWTMPVRDWSAARNQFMIRFGERMSR